MFYRLRPEVLRSNEHLRGTGVAYGQSDMPTDIFLREESAIMEGIPKNMDMDLSRREFLTTAVSAGGAMLFGSVCLNASGQADPRVAQVMSKTIGIDMHNHVYPK